MRAVSTPARRRGPLTEQQRLLVVEMRDQLPAEDLHALVELRQAHVRLAAVVL